MKISLMKKQIPQRVYELLEQKGFEELRPSQHKSISAGLFEDKNLLVCTPTASGKTLVAEFAFLNAVLHDKGKAAYIVPLKALASEKYKQFKQDYPNLKIGVSSGDLDSADTYLGQNDIIVTTSEKFDSLLRHKAQWIERLKTVVIDEIHLLNDVSRGPTLEIIITILKQKLKNIQIIGLSATIGNPEELANWLNAELIEDNWRPVKLRKGVYLDGEIEFDD
ncbi:DEAD/DEAH box helicase [Candidatus Woesearchaeota archaeon]|nr:DEAD/DEAH box helicase [Candidatus Woesearchaeota archaeon]